MLGTFASIQRLDFALPAFRRVAWVSEKARTAWELVLRQIVKAQPAVFGHAVEAGLYPCAVFTIGAWQIFGLKAFLNERPDLAMAILETHGTAEDAGDETPIVYRVVVGRADAVAAFEDAWHIDRQDVQFDLFNMPDCCRRFHDQTWGAWGLTDATLARALNTPGAAMTDRIVRLKAAPTLNTLWRGLDLQWLSHDPCSMQCAASAALATGWIQTGRDHGFADAMDALEAILSWPAEWSALHGIAEIKTPILKIAANTDATAETYRVQLLSDHYPDEGASGLHFPFRRPRFAPITDSKTFRKGLENPIRAIQDGEGLPQSLVEEPARSTANGHRGPLPPLRRSSDVLNRTLDRLRQRGALEGRAIKALFLSNFFNVVQLDDGSTGACINYYRFRSNRTAQQTIDWLTEKLATDPLLLTYLCEDAEPDLLQLSLRTCLVSAVSRPLLLHPETFVATDHLDDGLFAARTAVVVGFGGYMDYLVRGTNIAHIHISDRSYYRRAGPINKALDAYRADFPHKTITVSDGSDNRARMAEAELVSIKGDAFCDATMDALLDKAQPCKTVIVQGQSASVYPAVLFEKGVSMINTTIKPDHLMDLATTDFRQFRRALEGNLPLVYLRPS